MHLESRKKPQSGFRQFLSNRAQSRAIFPTSIGMSFCVDLEAKALQIIPNFGYYENEFSEYIETPTGKPKRVWKRIRGGGNPLSVPLQVGAFGPLKADDFFPDAVVRGLVRHRDDHWSVTAFLMNDGVNPPPKTPNRERTWMFQSEMIARAPDGGANLRS